MCGGTGLAIAAVVFVGGLSPRVRGNRRRGLTGALEKRSIPACAGEPGTRCSWWTTAGVYPRVCGGTAWCPVCRRVVLGLSPRVRGNRTPRRFRPLLARSIPACAGEPGTRCSWWTTAGVYPRVCGGTRQSRTAIRPAPGLSPRVRGNLQRPAPAALSDGSIPACAGEPPRPSRH